MMLGFLLTRAVVHGLVLEKHADFFRDFRGDTVHPSTLELIYELGSERQISRAPPFEGRPADHAGRGPTPDCRFQSSTDEMQVHRADATMGLSEKAAHP